MTSKLHVKHGITLEKQNHYKIPNFQYRGKKTLIHQFPKKSA